jgi:hypothetical protein
MSRNEARRYRSARPARRRRVARAGERREGRSGAAARQDRTNAQAAAATATTANTNIAASLTRRLDGLRPHAVDIAAGELETAGVVSHLEDGREVVVDLADIRKALAVETSSSEEQVSEAAE